METTIRPLTESDMHAASKLVQRVFDRFEGPDYPAEGIATFHRFTAPEALTARLHAALLQAWGAFRGDTLVGVLAVRDKNHISLLFVDETCHRQGIARALFDRVRDVCSIDTSISRLTVNSSPFAAEMYPRLGFTPTGPECTQDGIRFIPMQYVFIKYEFSL